MNDSRSKILDNEIFRRLFRATIVLDYFYVDGLK